MRLVGTTVRGIRTPIIKDGDDLVEIVTSALLRASEEHHFKFNDRDVVGVTEAVVAIAENNYVDFNQLVEAFHDKYPDEVGVVFPILSRNRFSMILKALVKASKKVHVLLSYPSDEVGNSLMDRQKMLKLGINPYKDCFGEKQYRQYFGAEVLHEFTGIDYVSYYQSFGKNVEIHFSNNPEDILQFAKHILVADIHTRFETTQRLRAAGVKNSNKVKTIYSLTDFFNKKSKIHGYNEKYGLLGSNKLSEKKLKLFPRACDDFVQQMQQRLKQETGKTIEVLVYGDGAFKDPVGGIWELADPVVSPGFTVGLTGRPQEIKLKYVSANWSGEGSVDQFVRQSVGLAKSGHGADNQTSKKSFLETQQQSMGTTPRQITDLLGTLCDLTSGSGDKGTPVVLVQGYFDDLTVA